MQRAAALVDEVHLVALAVPEEVVHRLARPDEGDLDVVLPHQQLPPRDLVALGLGAEGLEMAMRVRVRDPLLALDRLELAELLHAAGRDQVVEDRLVAREAFEAHHLLGEEGSVVPELDVALPRDLASALVGRHQPEG